MTMPRTSAPESLQGNFYVDDTRPTENEHSAIHLARDMVDVLAQGSFNLTKFTSNSKKVLKTVPSHKLSNQRLNIDLEDVPVERALRIVWLVGDDTLGFKIRHLDCPVTKHGILSTVCPLFGTLALAARSLV